MIGIVSKLMPERLYLSWKHYRYKSVCPERFIKDQEHRRDEDENGYSFKPFDETKSIFVHVPKCGGVSVCKALYGNLAGGHVSFNRYIHVFEPREIQNYFKFTFVRNPWDRLASAYHFLKKGGFNDSDRQFAEKELAEFDTFEEFVRCWVTTENIQKWCHFQPQCNFVLERNNKVKVDFVGYLENIEEDFKYVAGKLGVKTQLSKLNAKAEKKYTEYYNNETRDIVADVYAKDISEFEYTFSNSNLSQVLKNR